jgi:AAA family ATP:ADP antiporter
VYRFFAANLLLFFVLWRLRPETQGGPISNAFFVWVSVYNVFVVSVFWSFMADVFRLAESKRLFGCIAAGGSLGAIAGGELTRRLVETLGPVNLLLVSLVLLELSTQCMLGVVRARRLPDERPSHVAPGPEVRPEQQESGSAWNGFVLVAKSPYLMVIAAHFLLASGIGTVLYFEQSQLVRAAFTDQSERIRMFAKIDIWTNWATFAAQALVTAPLVRRAGIGVALILQPLVAVLALVGMALSPTLGVLITAQMTLRTLQHTTTRPAREMLFTVLGREVKYKSKSFVDTFVFRLGDQLGSWTFDALKVAGLSLGAIAWLTVPLTVAWCATAAGLGRMQKRFAREGSAGLPAARVDR